jgi:hypothetical protein
VSRFEVRRHLVDPVRSSRSRRITRKSGIVTNVWEGVGGWRAPGAATTAAGKPRIRVAAAQMGSTVEDNEDPDEKHSNSDRPDDGNQDNGLKWERTLRFIFEGTAWPPSSRWQETEHRNFFKAHRIIFSNIGAN